MYQGSTKFRGQQPCCVLSAKEYFDESLPRQEDEKNEILDARYDTGFETQGPTDNLVHKQRKQQKEERAGKVITILKIQQLQQLVSFPFVFIPENIIE